MGDAPDAEELRRVDVQKLKVVKARDDIGHGHCFELRTNLFMDNGKPRIYILSSKVTERMQAPHPFSLFCVSCVAITLPRFGPSKRVTG